MDAARCPDPMRPEPRRVLAVRRETHDTVSLTLEGGGSAALHPPPQPGQFHMLYAFAVGEVAVSVSGAAPRTGGVVHTVKAVGAVTEALCRLRRGMAVGLRGPYGRPWPLEEARGRDLLLVAGGLGLAPLRPVVQQVLRQRAAHGRVALLAGARTPADLPFRRELERWARRPGLRVLTTVDRAGPDWTGRVGVVPALLDALEIDAARSLAFVCGPEAMMRFTVRELQRRGLADERIHLSMERNMKCAIGLCGHCQWGPAFVCKDGPVFRFDRVRPLFWLREV